MPDPRLLLLDFDGVVLETVDAKEQAFRAVFAGDDDQRWARVLAEHRASHGRGREEKIERFFRVVHGRAPSPAEHAEHLAAFAREALRISLDSPEVPGVAALLRRLDGVTPVYVVTAAPEDEVRDICRQRGIDRLFRDIRGMPGAKADLIAECCRREGIPAAQALFVGDRDSDWRAATAAGVPFLGRVPAGADSPFPPGTPLIADFTGWGAA